MKQRAVLHDVIRDEPFGYAIKDGNSLSYVGLNNHANEWASWANQVAAKSEQGVVLPDGVILGPFTNVSDFVVDEISNSVGNSALVPILSKDYRLAISSPVRSQSRVPAVFDTPIHYFKNDSYSDIISYKALSFISDVKSASFLYETRMRGYAFDVETSKFNCRPSAGNINIFRNRVEHYIGRSHERRLGLKVLKHEEFSNERLISSIEDDISVKALGGVIGGTARRARRIGRGVTANFNPRAWDGDNDGLVQEGTAFERPSVPGVNDFNTRGRVNVDAAIQAAESQGIGKRSERGNKVPTRQIVKPTGMRSEREVTVSPVGKSTINKSPSLKLLDQLGFEMWTEKGGDRVEKVRVALPQDSALKKYFEKFVRPNMVYSGKGDAAPGTPTTMHVGTVDKGKERGEIITDINNLFGLNLRKGQYNKKEVLELKRVIESGSNEEIRELFKNATVNIPDSENNSTAKYGDLIANGKLIDVDKTPPSAGMESRRGRPVTSGARARRERAVTGMASQKQSAQKKGKGSAGITKVSERDGKAWESLTDAQRAIVKENLRLRRKELEDQFRKGGWEDWLAGYIAKRDKKLPKFDFYNSPFDDETMSSLGFAVEGDILDIDADPNLDDAAKDRAKMSLQRLYDDLLAIKNMQKNDDYSLLEHLHPQSRKAAFGVRPKNDKWVPSDGNGRYASPLDDGQKAPKGILSNDESTFFGKYGNVVRFLDEGKTTTAGTAKVKKRTAQKLKKASRRIFVPNPERQARRERRRARRLGTARAGTLLREEDFKKRTLAQRLRRAKRTISARIRGKETPSQIFERTTKDAVPHPLKFKGDSPETTVIEVTDTFINRMAFTGARIDSYEKGETELTRGDAALAFAWENMEQNGLPTLITEEQGAELIESLQLLKEEDRDYRLVTRGVGNNPAFAEEYLANEDRFPPGGKDGGARAYGTGEYWANNGNTDHSWIYGNSNIVAFLSPKARVISQSQLKKIHSDGNKIRDMIRGFDKSLANGEAEKMDPADYVAELKKFLAKTIPSDDGLWKTQFGQIYNQMLDRYAQLAPDSDKRRELWNAIQYVNKMLTHDAMFSAPFLGYDAVDVGQANITLVHNRKMIIAIDRVFNTQDGRKFVQDAKSGNFIESATKKPSKPSKAAKSAVDVSNWQRLPGEAGRQKGSNPGGGYKDPNTGKEYYIKVAKSQSHLENEILSSRLYEALGVPASRVQGGSDNGSPRIVSEMIPESPRSGDMDSVNRSIRAGYVADAWLANWDAMANSGNTIQDRNGNSVRIDHGGSLRYRAQGGQKLPVDWGNEATTMETLRDPAKNPGAASILRGITQDEIRQQVDALRKVTDQMIKQMVSDTISDPQEAAELIRKLISRRQWIIKNYG